MKLNLFQIKIIQQKLQENNWELKSGGKLSVDSTNFAPWHLSFPDNINDKAPIIYSHQSHNYGYQDLTIRSKGISLGIHDHELFTWEKLLDFIELRLKVIYQAPMTYLGTQEYYEK